MKKLTILLIFFLSYATPTYAGRYSGVCEALNAISHNLNKNNSDNKNSSQFTTQEQENKDKENLTIQSKYIDVKPNDGVMDIGSSTNPYVIQNEKGETIAIVKPKYMDLEPNDGLMDAGSPSNPYIIQRTDEK